jgi:VWFA-related protein
MNWGRLLLCVPGAVTLAAQGLAPDEVHASRSPYVPPPPPTVLRTEVTLVDVPVVVRDRGHRAVAGLKQGDFEVFDGSKKQTISAFSVETFTPAPAGESARSASAAAAVPPEEKSEKAEHPARYVVLCFDNMSTKFGDLQRTKAAAGRFVRTSLAPGDLVTVVTTASSAATTFTSDVSKLIESIEKIAPQPRFSDDDSFCPRITGYQAYVIANHLDNQTLAGVVAEDAACKGLLPGAALEDVKAIVPVLWEHAKANSENTLHAIQSVVDALGKMPGQRLLLLLGSGFLSGNLEYMEDELISRAVHAGVVINALDAKGLYGFNPGGRPINVPPPRGASAATQNAEARIQGRQAQAKDDGMAVLALGTGGAFYHNSNDFDRGFRELAVLPEVLYVLGFSPGDTATDGRYHNLKVKLAGGNHYSVEARLGYTAPGKTPPAEQKPQSRLDQEVLASDTVSDVPASMTIEPSASGLTVVMRLDLSRLKFETRADRRAQKLKLIAALLDKRGNFVTGMQGEVDLSLKPATYERLAQSGFNIRLTLQAPAGPYTLRGLVEEGLDGKMSASSQAVELH